MIKPNSTIVGNVRTQDLIRYLELSNWQDAAPFNTKWFVFRGPNDADGDPLEIVIPRDETARDLPVYLASAVNLLSALVEENPTITVRRIGYYNVDVLSVRNTKTGDRNLISISTAAKQISDLKRLVRYSACSEQNPLPYFEYTNLSSALKMERHYQFGHTYRGSFGYTVESPLIHERIGYESHNFEEISILPLERRVMERIIRGLQAVNQSVKEHSIEALLDSYSWGFNANMCRAVANMSDLKRMPLEYGVIWSPKITPSEDIANIDPVSLNETSYLYLERAAVELSTFEPEMVTIRGTVTDLSSKKNPFGTGDVPRTVVVRWLNRPGGRSVGVMMSLDKEDYAHAIEAHEKWLMIEVTGNLTKVGSTWRLAEPRDFYILGPSDPIESTLRE